MFFKKKEVKEYSGKIDRFGSFSDGDLSMTRVHYALTLEGTPKVFVIPSHSHPCRLALSRPGDEMVIVLDYKDRVVGVKNATLGITSGSPVSF